MIVGNKFGLTNKIRVDFVNIFIFICITLSYMEVTLSVYTSIWRGKIRKWRDK